MKDKRRSKLLSIKDLTKEFYEKDKIKKGLRDITIYETWKKISDIKILERTKKVFTKGNKLYIQITSAPLRNELTNNKVSIMRKLNKEHKLIEDLYFI